MPPAPNAWGSLSLLSLKNDGGSGSFGNINDRPSTGGSSRTSTDGSDLLDSPLAWGGTSHNSTTAISHPQITDSRSGSSQFPRSQTSFSDVLKSPLRIIAKMAIVFKDDQLLVLLLWQPEMNKERSRQLEGILFLPRTSLWKHDRFNYMLHRLLIYVCLLHVLITGILLLIIPLTEMRFGMEWHHGPCKPADTPGSFLVESFSHNDQFLLNQGGEARHGAVPGGYHPENKESCCAHAPADACINDLPHLMLGKVKHNHSDALEKQVIKKDVALLEKIKCLNIKARNRLAGNISEISSRRESKVEHPKTIDLEAYHVTNDVPFSVVISDITSAFDMANSVSESINHVPIGTSNVSASANLVMVDMSEGHVTKFSKDQPFAGNRSQQVHVKTGDDMLNFPDYEIQLSRRGLSAQHARQLQEEKMGELQQNATPLAKLEELNRTNSTKNTTVPISSSPPPGTAGVNRGPLTHNEVPSVKRTDINMLEHSAQKWGAQPHDGSAPNHLQVGDREGLVHKQESISRVSTSASDTADANNNPLIQNVTPSAKSTAINMIHIDQKGASESHDSTAPMLLQMKDKRRQVHSLERIFRGPPASESAGGNKGSLIHNVLPSAKEQWHQHDGIYCPEKCITVT
ncbi:hypothetical protein C2845_PM17G14820 [Panicum miliaceum]|uniref:Uncharacterized protein n=1 Tax=Panicum miliaceum TaxID=4540 RepID=A0A3L6Q2E6_PANMI|nr:hypothetical protein C2845_PM17G14820 [Panicum miliaceum]